MPSFKVWAAARSRITTTGGRVVAKARLVSKSRNAATGPDLHGVRRVQLNDRRRVNDATAPTARTSAERAAQLAKTRYEAGTSPYLDVIEANRTTLATQRATAQIAGQRLIATVGLVKALGGGWQASQPAGQAPPWSEGMPRSRSGSAGSVFG